MDRLHNMYDYLCNNGYCYYIGYNKMLVGDVTLKHDGEVCIVICSEYQNMHIGRRVISQLITMGREKGINALKAHIYTFNCQSRRMFTSVGFVRTEDEIFEYKL